MTLLDNCQEADVPWLASDSCVLMYPLRRALPAGTVTFFFTDMEGSTKLLRGLGAETYAENVAQLRGVVRQACAAWGGVEVDTQGDAFFIAFSRARDAVAAAAGSRSEQRSNRPGANARRAASARRRSPLAPEPPTARAGAGRL
jgi:class 3 adenylate cyclase